MSIAGSVRHQRRNSVATTTSDNAQDPYMAALVDSRCLSICISLLERVNGVSARTYVHKAFADHSRS